MKPPRPHRLQRETVVADRGGGFTARTIARDGFPFAWHYHPEVELTLITAGRGLRFVGDSVEHFREGDCVLLGGDCPHTWFSAPVAGRPARALVIQFPATLFTGLAQLPELTPVAALLERARRGLAIGRPARTEVAALMAEICAVPAGDARRLTALIEALALIARDRQGRTLASGVRPADAAAQRRLGEVLAWVQQHHGEAIAQPGVAARAGLSPAAFSRFFRRTVGRTFVAYLAELRVGTACRLLIEDGRDIAAIALAAGFGNLSNFNRRFRAVKGMAPSAYRRLALRTAGG